MSGVVERSFPVATVCLEQRKAPGSVEGTLLSFEDAKAPWNMEVSPTVAAAVFCSQSKSKSRAALLELLNACGVSPAARRLALDILMKLVLREAGKFDGMLFSKIICSLAENRDSLLEYLVHKYFVYGGTRYHASIILNQVCSKEENMYGCSYDTDAIVDSSSPAALGSAFQAVFTTKQKAALERDKQLEHIDFPVHNELDSRDCDNLLFHGSKLKDESSEEQNGRCTAKVPNSVMQEPDKVVTAEDLSSMILSAARVRENDANNSKAPAARKKSEEDEDEDDGDEEEGQEDDQGGGESGGDEGDSDEPGQAGNEEEEGEEEEEEENEEEDEDDEDEQPQPQPQPQQQQQQPRLNLNNINNNGGGELDEDEENDGGVEDDDDGGDGDGGEDEDEEDEEDPEVAPPKKKQRK